MCHCGDLRVQLVRGGAVLPLGARTDRPDYDYLDGLELRVFAGLGAGESRTVEVVTPEGRRASYTVSMGADGEPVVETDALGWRVSLAGTDRAR